MYKTAATKQRTGLKLSMKTKTSGISTTRNIVMMLGKVVNWALRLIFAGRRTVGVGTMSPPFWDGPAGWGVLPGTGRFQTSVITDVWGAPPNKKHTLAAADRRCKSSVFKDIAW